MTVTTFALGLAYLGSAIGVAMVIPQILRIVRHPAMGGVSPWTWAITATSCVLWMAYGVRTGSLPQIPGNVLLVTGAVVIVLLVPAAWSRLARGLLLGTVVLGLLAVSTRLQPEQVGFLAFGIGVCGMWPQVYETVWARRGMGPSAISLTSQALKLASQSCWITFALLTLDVPVIVSALMALSTNAVVTVVELSRRRAAVAELDHADPGLAGRLVTADA
ncbi:MAG: PQ-loop domain-containing transporter [Candidatus Nanopelagicales bacterium]